MLTKKQAKEFDYLCKSYTKKNKDFLLSLSPLQGFFNGEWDWIDIRKEFFCNNDRYSKDVRRYIRKGFYQEDFERILVRVINADIEIQRGNIGYISVRGDAVKQMYPLIGCINNKRKVDLIHKLCSKSGLSENTLFIIKMVAYGTIEKYDDESKELTRLCTGGNKREVIYSAAAEEDILLEEMQINGNISNKQEIMRFELEIIKEKIAKGEVIQLFRGFAISSDERVRKGYKQDGEKYFKQCAGAGISYSLNRNVAGYFAMLRIMMEDGKFVEGGNLRTSQYYLKQDTIFANLISREDFVKARAQDISDMRDKRKLKPIIAEYVLEPEKVKGYLVNLGESEMMALPEDMKLVHYDIPHSRDIARCEYEFINKGSNALTAINFGLIDNGIVCWVSQERYGKIYAIFAPANEIKDYAKKFVDIYFSGKSQREIDIAAQRFHMSMEKYAIQLPESVVPTSVLLSNRLYEYLREPYNVVKEAGRRYRIGTYKD